MTANTKAAHVFMSTFENTGNKSFADLVLPLCWRDD
jgi:hypothetical protein